MHTLPGAVVFGTAGVWLVIQCSVCVVWAGLVITDGPCVVRAVSEAGGLDVTEVGSSTRRRTVERLTLVTGMLLVTVGGAGVVLAVWVTTDARLATDADVVVPVTDGSVVVRLDSVNPDVCSLVVSVVCVVATGVLVVVSVEAVVILSVGMVMRWVVSVVSFVVGGEVLVVTVTPGVSSCVVATDTHEVTTGVTRVVSSGVDVLVVSRKTADVCVVEAVDGTAGETLVVSVTRCVVIGLVVDV